jgi:hypothetical protein
MKSFKDTPRAYSPEELAKDLLGHLKKPRIWYGHKAFDEIAGPLEGGKWIYAVVYPPVDFLSLTVKLAGSVALQGGAVLIVNCSIPVEKTYEKFLTFFTHEELKKVPVYFSPINCIEELKDIATHFRNLKLVIVDDYQELDTKCTFSDVNTRIRHINMTIKQTSIRYCFDIITFDTPKKILHDYIHQDADIILGLHRLTYPPQNMIEVIKNRYGPQKFEIVCNL